MKFKKFAKCSLAVALVFGAASALAGCGNDDDKTQAEKTEQEKVYDLYVSYMNAQGQTPLTYNEWLNSIKGEAGAKGDKGDKGDTGATGEAGATWLTGSGAPTTQGKNGDFYLDSTNNQIYNKVDGVWNLVTTIEDGTQGVAGNGISSIEKTATNGNVDTYTITFTDNTINPVTFNVTNGTNGASITNVALNNNGELLVTLSSSATPINVGNVKGSDGRDLTITEITTTSGSDEDTYAIKYSDGTNFEFTVKHGKDGKDGTTWLSGTTAPLATLVAKDGDFYFDRTNNDIYLYDENKGGWVLEVNLPVDEEELTTLEDGQYTGFINGCPFVATIENHLISSIEIEGLPQGTVVSNYGYDIEDGVIIISVDVLQQGGSVKNLREKYTVDGFKMNVYVSENDYELIKGKYVSSRQYGNAKIIITSDNIYYTDGSDNVINTTYEVLSVNEDCKYDLLVNLNGDVYKLSLDVLNDEFEITPADGEVVYDENQLLEAVNNGVEKIYLYNDIQVPVALEVSHSLTVNLNGYTLSLYNDEVGDGVFHVLSGGDLTIKGEGFIDGSSQYNDYGMAIWADGGNVTINGGVFTNLGTKSYEDDGTTLNNNELIYVSNGGVVTINDGVFIGNNSKWVLNSNDKNKGTFIVKGGMFADFDPSNTYTEPAGDNNNFVAEGYTVVKVFDSESGYLVSIIVKEDVVANPVVKNEGHHVIEEVISVSGDDTDAVTAAGNSVVEITGGYYNGGVGDQHTAVWAKDDAVVEIYDGYFTVSGVGAVDGYNDVIYAKDNAQINIYGGFFEGPGRDNDGQRFLLNLKDNSNARITVYGGVFVNFDPSKTGTEPIGVNDNFVAEGYEVIALPKSNGDVWYVVVRPSVTITYTIEGIGDSGTLSYDVATGEGYIDVYVDSEEQMLDVNCYRMENLLYVESSGMGEKLVFEIDDDEHILRLVNNVTDNNESVPNDPQVKE